MKIVLRIGFLALLVSLLCPSQQTIAQSASAESTPLARVIVALKDYPFFSGLPEISTRTQGSIRVVVIGRVKRPGIYYLPQGATVNVAVEAAGGFSTEFARWSASGILRPINAERAEKIGFPLQHTKRSEPELPLREEVSLQEGDRVFIGELHE